MITSLLVTATVILWGLPAAAGLVTYEFIGTVESGTERDLIDAHLTGTFSYDTTSISVGGTYPTAQFFHFSVGSHVNLSAPIDSIVISNGSPFDTMQIGARPSVNQGAALIFQFEDPRGSAFDSYLLKDSLPPISAFSTASFFGAEFIAGVQISLFLGTIDSLTRIDSPAAAPEPSTWVLLGTGTIALFFIGRRRRSEKGIRVPATS